MVTVLISTRSGGGSHMAAREKLTDLLTAALPGAQVVFLGPETDVREVARQAVERGSTMVVAGGGDGTLSAVAGALVGSDIPFGVIPLGTLNHLAKDLGIPLDMEAAVQTLAAGRVVPVDVGEVNGQTFMNNSGLGLYPAIVRLRELKQNRGVAKWPAAIWATIKALSRYERLGIRVEVEEQTLLRRTPVVFVGNNEYSMEGVRLPARERLDQGHLCIYIPHVQGRFRLIWFSIRALFGRPRPDGEFDAFLTEECWIDARRAFLRISLDGEVATMKPPLHFRILPGALRVMVPPPPPAPAPTPA